MSQDDLRDVCKSFGWSLISRRKWRRLYWYAAKRIDGKRVEKYLFPDKALSEKVRTDVWLRLL